MTAAPIHTLRRATLFLTILAMPLLTGCAGFGSGGSGGSGSLISDSQSRELRLTLPNRAAVVQDQNTADVYLTDLSDDTLERIASGQAAPEVSGTLVHIHIFLNPKPGKTPIEPTAASASARVVVLARGNVGVYDGAGFLLAGKSLEKGRASGTLRNAHTRLSRATAGFQDLLGQSTLEITFGARDDKAKSDAIARAVRLLSAAADPIE